MKEFLDYAAQKYYDGEPIITDAEFDYVSNLFDFNNLGAPPSSGGISHLYRLYSLKKYYETDELPISVEKCVKTPKLDGSCISLTYVDGKLSRALTRGDGFIGEDISNNIIGWEHIPEFINSPPNTVIQIVGEIVAPESVENSRNYASGAVRNKDKSVFLSKTIEFIAYSVLYNGLPFIAETYEGDLEWLEGEGFLTVLEDNLEDTYPTDGVVYRLNKSIDFLNAGFTSLHPKGSFALKNSEQFEAKETVLRDVTWQIGKSGKVTPVAHFDSIVLEDANVSKATLHNAGFIENMDLHYEDRILVTRAGGIIPKVLSKAL